VAPFPLKVLVPLRVMEDEDEEEEGVSLSLPWADGSATAAIEGREREINK
jgi:hypothetical protein